MKEKYWADVMPQMESTQVHVSDCERAQRKGSPASEGKKVEVTEGEEQRDEWKYAKKNADVRTTFGIHSVRTKKDCWIRGEMQKNLNDIQMPSS